MRSASANVFLPWPDLAQRLVHVSQASPPLVSGLVLTNVFLQGFPWQGSEDRLVAVSKLNREMLQGRTDGPRQHAKSLDTK